MSEIDRQRVSDAPNAAPRAQQFSCQAGQAKALAISLPSRQNVASGSLWPGICRSYGAHPPLGRKRTALGTFAMIGLTVLFLFGVLPAAVVIYAVVVSVRP